MNRVNSMTTEERSQGHYLCISDDDFDELEREMDIGSQARDLNGDRFVKIDAVTIYTHHVNRRRGL